MGSWTRHQQAAVGGMVAVVLLFGGTLIAGSPPKFAASASKVTAYYSDHHGGVLTGMILTGIAIPFFVWFIAHLADAAGAPIGRVIGLGGVLTVALGAVGDGMNAALAQVTAAGGSQDFVHGMYQVYVLGSTRTLWAGTALAAGVAVASTRGALPSWACPVAVVQGVILAVGGLSLKADGFFSPTGAMIWIAYLAFFVGALAYAVALWQASPEREVVTATAASAV